MKFSAAGVLFASALSQDAIPQTIGVIGWKSGENGSCGPISDEDIADTCGATMDTPCKLGFPKAIDHCDECYKITFNGKTIFGVVLDNSDPTPAVSYGGFDTLCPFRCVPGEGGEGTDAPGETEDEETEAPGETDDEDTDDAPPEGTDDAPEDTDDDAPTEDDASEDVASEDVASEDDEEDDAHRIDVLEDEVVVCADVAEDCPNGTMDGDLKYQLSPQAAVVVPCDAAGVTGDDDTTDDVTEGEAPSSTFAFGISAMLGLLAF